MTVPNTVTLKVAFPNKPTLTIEVPWFLNMNVQQLLESACLIQEALSKSEFKFTLKYSGQTSLTEGVGVLGYEVISINGLANKEEEDYWQCWNFSIKDRPSNKDIYSSNEGINSFVLIPNDEISFVYKKFPKTT